MIHGILQARTFTHACAFPGVFAASLVAVLASAAAVPQEARAQRLEPPAAPGTGLRTQVQPDTIPGPPLTPARAFLYSLALPGYSQTRLGRPAAAALFIGVEVGSIAMLRRSVLDLRHAQRMARDSVILAYTIDPVTGLPERDPDTGELVVASFGPALYSRGLINARRTHVEDWLALVLFNHLVAGADAFVAAQLWDVPIQVRIRSTPGGPMLSGRIPW